MYYSIKMSAVESNSVRFQDDFDNAINASWKKENPIPDKYPRFTNFTVLTERTEEVMKEICNNQDNGLINRLYQLYLNQDETQLKAHIATQLEELNNVTTKTELIHYLCRQIVTGDYRMFHIYHCGTCRNPKFQIPHFNFGGLSLPDRKYYFEEEDKLHRNDFEAMVTNIFSGLGLTTEYVNSIWDIETLIAEKHYNRAEKRDPLKTYHPTTLRQLINVMGPDFSILEEVLPSEYHDITVNNDELPQRFAEVYRDCTMEELRTWLTWKTVRGYVGSSNGELYQHYFEFYGKKLSGTKVPRPFEERAVLFTKSHLEDEFSRIYMQDYVDPRLVTEFPVFVEQLRDTLRAKMQSFDWMTESTKQKAVEKLDGMTLKVVGPSKYEDYSVFDKEYETVYEFLDDYSQWDWDVLEVQRKMYKLHDPETWEMAALDVNAYYHPFYNEIVFPAGILQEPFYSPDNCYGANAGGIGAVICHEMSHGFDDEGSKYDKDGYLHSWWTSEDREKYEAVIRPMEEYFDSLSYDDETPLNGRLTQGENLADLGGLKCALASCPDDEQRRECLYAWARTWRANIRDEYAKQMTVVDPHSLPHYRINGILPHVRDFYELFNVTGDDKMYLEEDKRCCLYD